jgi:hypothetical protein
VAGRDQPWRSCSVTQSQWARATRADPLGLIQAARPAQAGGRLRLERFPLRTVGRGSYRYVDGAFLLRHHRKTIRPSPDPSPKSARARSTLSALGGSTGFSAPCCRSLPTRSLVPCGKATIVSGFEVLEVPDPLGCAGGLAPALSSDVEADRRSARRLAELRPRLTCFGHDFALTDPGPARRRR